MEESLLCLHRTHVRERQVFLDTAAAHRRICNTSSNFSSTSLEESLLSVLNLLAYAQKIRIHYIALYFKST